MPAVRLAEAQHAHRPAYKYMFTWESPMLGSVLGSCHGIDVPFVFGSVDGPGADLFVGSGPEVQELCDRTMQAWVGFARHGAPGHFGEWPTYEPSRRATMLLGAECSVAEDPLAAERRAWGRSPVAGAETPSTSPISAGLCRHAKQCFRACLPSCCRCAL